MKRAELCGPHLGVLKSSGGPEKGSPAESGFRRSLVSSAVEVRSNRVAALHECDGGWALRSSQRPGDGQEGSAVAGLRNLPLSSITWPQGKLPRQWADCV